MPLVAHPVRSLWGSQPRCARCVCEWLHRKWDGATVNEVSEDQIATVAINEICDALHSDVDLVYDALVASDYIEEISEA